MRLTLLGTGSILTAAFGASAIIDGQIMVDVPNGAMKAMRRTGLDPRKIDLVLITHFHGDHYFDLPFLLTEQGLREERESPLEVVGPAGLDDRLRRLFDLAYPESWDHVRSNVKLSTVELKGPGPVPVAQTDVSIEAFAMDHVGYDAYGFVVRRDGRTLGYSGDTRLCDGVHQILEQSDLAVLDMAFIEPRSGHMGVGDVTGLAGQYGERVELVATHLSDEVRSVPVAGVVIPNDGDSFEV